MGYKDLLVHKEFTQLILSTLWTPSATINGNEVGPKFYTFRIVISGLVLRLAQSVEILLELIFARLIL